MFLNDLEDDWKLLRKASFTFILERARPFGINLSFGTELNGPAGPGLGARACVARFQAAHRLLTVSLCVGGTTG